MKKKMLTILVTLTVLLLYAGCDINLFSSFASVPEPSLSGPITAKAIGEIKDYVVSGYFDDASTAKQDEIIGYLQDQYSGGIDSPETEQAAALAGQLTVKQDPNIGKTVNNVVDALMNMEGEEEGEPEDMIKELFPPNLTEVEFTAMLDKMVEAAAHFEAFAVSLGAEGTSSGTYSDSEKLTIAQQGLVCLLVAEALAVDGVDSEALYGWIYQGGVTNPFDGKSFEPSIETGQIANLLDFAGISLGDEEV